MSEDEDKQVIEKPEVHAEHHVHAKRQTPQWLPWVGGGVLVVLLLLGAFWAGRGMNRGRSVTIDRDDNFSTTRGYSDIPGSGSGTQTMPSGGFRGRGMMGTLGTVTAISSDSITIKDTQRGGLVTFKISSSTTVTSGTDTKAVSDIKTDATVRIEASTSDSLTAASIAIQS
jgi:hypothetical protein